MQIYFRCNSGGWNKNNGTVEKAVRIDSFDVAQIGTWGDIWAGTGSTSIPIYGEEMFCILFPLASGEQQITLSRKPNGYGGEQTFFVCPICQTRRRYLYFVGRDNLFKCRKCSHLNYKSQQRTRGSMDGYTEGIKLAREKLGVRDVQDGFEFIDWVPPKPRYMHNVTYRRILERFTKHHE